MPRTAEQSALVRQKRRAKILSKALHQFALLSFDELTIDDIATACNCSHGLFYHYFDSKEAVYAALMEDRLQKHPNWVFPYGEALELGGLDGLKRSLEFVRDRLHDAESAVLYLKIDLTAPFSTLKSTVDLTSQNIHETFIDLIKQGQEKGEIRQGNSEHYAVLLTDALTGACLRRLSLGDPNCVTTDIDIILSMLAA